MKASDTAAVVFCRICRQEIVGQHFSTQTYHYHADCFRCNECLRFFPDNAFIETEKEIYCEEDYNVLCLARCPGCGETITGKCISALDSKWHLEHFNCVDCARSLVGGSFVRKDDKPHCKVCPMDKQKIRNAELAWQCDHCNLAIDRNPLLFKGKKYHGEHFHCNYCHKQLDHTARELAGELYCFADFERFDSKICAVCRKPIFGNSTGVSALGKVFHQEHFVCHKCEMPFNGMKHFTHDGFAYCELHYKQAIGSICQYCRQAVKGDGISALDGKWCEIHFQCLGCFVSLADLERSKFMDFDGKPFCRRCFEKIPMSVRRAMTTYTAKEAKYF